MSSSTDTTGATAATTAEKQPADTLSQDQLRQRAALARRELATTLDAIEYKLNVPRQVRATSQRVALELHKLGRDKPLALAGIAAGVASVMGTAVGGIVWASTRIFRRRGDRATR
jgi:hypothetical protein